VKRRSTSAILHGVTSQKAIIFKIACVRAYVFIFRAYKARSKHNDAALVGLSTFLRQNICCRRTYFSKMLVLRINLLCNVQNHDNVPSLM
jgi:hypothetical protein